MYHKALEADLKAIFGMPKVLFGAPAFGKEQDIIFCEIERAKIVKRRGQQTARVEGSISIIGVLNKNKSGYLSERIQLAPVELTERFFFAREEAPVKMGAYNEFFNTYSLEFIYFYKEEFNPPSGKIKSENLLLRIIDWVLN